MTIRSFYMITLLVILSMMLVFASMDDIRAVALRPRNLAPKFTAKAVIDDKFITINLNNYQNDGKWVILLFYPYDHTFVCPVSPSMPP
jgi:hypothetical protein